MYSSILRNLATRSFWHSSSADERLDVSANNDIKQTDTVNCGINLNMATFKIDDVEYDTDKLDTTQKRVVGLYQKSLQEEGEALNNLEIARAARIELGRKLKELVIEKSKK